MGVNSILVIFQAMGLDEMPQGGNVERNEQQAPKECWVSLIT